MKKMLLSMALAALVASPALAATARQQSNAAAHRASASQPMPSDQAAVYGYGPANGPGVVTSAGRILGQDPDPNIQLQLRRDPVADY